MDDNKGAMKKLGVAAVILLAPGGFLFGAALAAQYLRRKAAERRESAGD